MKKQSPRATKKPARRHITNRAATAVATEPQITGASRNFTINGAQVRHHNFEGRDHLVAPVVAVVEGVLNGQLLTFDEISAYPQAWEGIPLPVYHPRRGGEPVSANSPDILESVVIGRFFNSTIDAQAKSLKGELWIDVEKAAKVAEGADIIKRLEEGGQLEVSTSYFADIEETSGVWGNEKYSGIQHNLRPDHLALLPNQTGACNWLDGCGAPRTNAVKYLAKDTNGTGHLPYTDEQGNPDHRLMGAAWAALHGGYRGNKYQGPGKAEAVKRLKAVYKSENMPLPSENEAFFANSVDLVNDRNAVCFTLNATSAVSFDETARMVRDALNSEDPTSYHWLADVFNSFVVYEKEPRPVPGMDGMAMPASDPSKVGMFKRDYSIKNDQVTMGDPAQVKRRMSYIEIPAAPTGNAAEPQPQEAQTIMDKTKIIDALIKNDKTIWKEEHRAFLVGLSECDLKALDQAPAAPAPAAAAPVVQAAPVVPAKPKTVDEFLSDIADPRLRAVISNGIAAHDARKNELVATLAANKACAFSKDELQAMELSFLEKLAVTQGVSFAGAGAPRTNRQTVVDNDDDIPAPPAVLTAPVVAASK